ncbi:non-ribosomal peptide synthetase [Nonomuraea basaltis]|uniref:non-ribosomal peptide synthetase n=1 Tax=Nonomuraea basaltis TaxID=2495887 RepID=UPI00110C6E00|nr:non-ribosomal peptide synthetase [Nonomuraea basaltis]TMR89701.1 amino acid adenylation domain-containing protein [Nonomuraea basaltis]
MSETGGPLEWLSGPDDPGPFPVAGPPGVRAPEVLAAWGALLYHHTGRRDLAFRVVRGGADELVRFAIDPGATLAELVTSVTRALGAAGPYDPGLGPMPVLVHGDPVPPGALALVLDGNGVRLRPGPGRNADLAARHADHLAAALATPADTAIRDLDPLSPAERAELDRWNDTAGDYPGDIRVERLFAEQAEQAPGHPAVVHGDTTLTYADLHRRSTLLAQSVRHAGLASGDPVALLLPRVPDLVVAALAVLKAGGCYLPIDPSTPPGRVSLLLADSGASLLIAPKRSGARARIIAMDALDWSAEPEPEDPALSDTSAPAYLMYTSGTTGRPKGVAIPHRGIVRLVRGVDYARLDPSTRMAQIGATGFDASVWEMWGALLNGGTLHLLDRETFLDAEELRKALTDRRITTALFTSALFGRLADQDPTLFRPLRDLLVGGDVVSPKHARSVLRANPGLRLVNAYGPTENAVISTVHVVAEPIGARVPIGRPVPNASAYVLNQDRRPLPIGVPGDLYVGGDGMAPGYHGRPELTRRAFVPHPLWPGRLLYRTGDRARRLPDGSIDFLGRTDHQVKVRGFRVEPGEVETALLNATGVSGAVVVERSDTFDSHLCAYVTGKEGLQAERVRAEIERVLPPHMVPAHIVVLPALPLTANGKVDRTALPDTARRGGGRAARDEVERVLVELWENVLGVRGIGVDDALDQLGGSSLTATRLAALVRRRFGIDCPVSAVLSARTISALARTIRMADRTGRRLAGPRPGKAAERTPLSPQQRGIYVEQLKDPAGTQYNVPIFVDLPAPVDPGPLRAASAALADRHEILRTDIAVDGDGRPHLRVHERLAVTLDEVDLPRGADPDAWAERWIRPFDLALAPLWRVALVRHDTGTRLVLDIHHLLTDGHALTLLMSEWAALIRGDRLPEVELRYRDFAQWANGPEKQKLSEAQRPYWAETFARPVRPLDLPTDLPRPAVRRTEGAHLHFEFGARRSDAIAELASAEGVTPFHVLLAAYTAFLGQVSGSDDVTVGTAASGRHLPGVDRAQGMFVNTLCLRTRPEAELPFRAYLRAAAEHATAALDHQDHAFDALVAQHEQHDLSRNPLFDTFFAVQDTGLHHVDFLGGRPRWRPDATRRTIFDLDLQIEVAGARPGGYAARWAYATSLFLRPTVELFRDELLALLDAVLAEPGTPLGELGRVAATPYDLSELALDFDL